MLLTLVRIGLRIDGWFVTNHIDAFRIAMAIALAIQLGSRVLRDGRPGLLPDLPGSRSNGRLI